MLKDLRKALSLSINDLSEIIDVSSRTIRRWEEGSIPTPQAVTDLLKYYLVFGVSVLPDTIRIVNQDGTEEWLPLKD